MQIETLDLDFGNTARTIASFLITGSESPVLIESGPGSTLPTLIARLDERGMKPTDIGHVLLTHIHLDHAGAAGWWAQQGATVYVHPNGAPHLIDPSKLLASAERIYGDRMDELWGEILPAPKERVVVVRDGDVIDAGGLKITAIDTPGHARHHHVYRLEESGFTGDAAGIHLADEDWVDLPAPPPEFDLAAWKVSLKRIRDEDFSTIYRTHFGPATEVEKQLEIFEKQLEDAAKMVRQMVQAGLDRETMVKEYLQSMRRRSAAHGVDDEMARAYELANPRAMSVDGIARYWKKRASA